MSHSEANTGSSGLHWAENEQTMSGHALLMTGTVMSHNPRILASEGNPASYVQADGSNYMSLILIG